ncbi:MAG: tol-pal system YbgF family protein [Aureispira sp.]
MLNKVLSQLEQFPNLTIALKAQMNLGNLQLKKKNYPEALKLLTASCHQSNFTYPIPPQTTKYPKTGQKSPIYVTSHPK